MRTLVGGQAAGVALVLDAPISLWGGVDPHSGRIVERSHPQHGADTAGRILVMPRSRGSSSSSSVLAELLRLGNGPAAVILGEPESILAVGSLVARHLYGAICPVLVGAFPGSSGERWEVRDTELRRIPAS